MTTVTEQDYVDSISTRTDDRPRRRAELSDRLGDAAQLLDDALWDIRHRGEVELEGWDDAKVEEWAPIEDTLDVYRRAAKEFEDAVTAVVEFLPGETGSKPREEAV
jgi:hypothetical protein